MSHSHTKTPGGAGASDKAIKQDAEKHGLGASNAPGHTEGSGFGEKPVASDSGSTSVGIDSNATNVPGEKGIDEPTVTIEPNNAGQATMQ